MSNYNSRKNLSSSKKGNQKTSQISKHLTLDRKKENNSKQCSTPINLDINNFINQGSDNASRDIFLVAAEKSKDATKKADGSQETKKRSKSQMSSVRRIDTKVGVSKM